MTETPTSISDGFGPDASGPDASGPDSRKTPPRDRDYKETALPYLVFPQEPMELFDPEAHLPPNYSKAAEGHSGPSGALPPLPLYVAARAHPDKRLIPREQDCFDLWDRYAMLDNIRLHSRRVADLACGVSLLARDKGIEVVPEAMLAAGLLHDLAKTYTISHGGSHAQLGAAWVMNETRNPEIARAVLFHVHWPWEDALCDDRIFMTMALEYADKRVRHDSYVSLDERFADLLVRYGVDDYARTRIRMSHEQGKRIEAGLSARLGVNLHEYTADSGRLVKRA